MEVVSIRLCPEMVARLKLLARREALRRGEDVTWARLVREALEQKLLDEEGVVYPHNIPCLPKSNRVPFVL
jgi:predicted DNA-binding protein